MSKERLDKLEIAHREDYPEQYGLNERSRSDFSAFIEGRVPPDSIAAGYKGLIVATWRDQDGSLSIEFLGDGEVHLTFNKTGERKISWGCEFIDTFDVNWPDTKRWLANSDKL